MHDAEQNSANGRRVACSRSSRSTISTTVWATWRPCPTTCGLSVIGVARFDSHLRDGHSEFFSSDGQRVVSEAAHELLTIADVTDRDTVVEHLARHQRGETGYVEMSKGLADSGVEKWTMDTNDLTVTYLDNQGNTLLVEPLQ